MLLQALSLVSLVSQATDSAVSTGQNAVEAQQFQRSMLQAVAGLFNSNPITSTCPTSLATNPTPVAAYLPPHPISRPVAAAAPQSADATPDSPLLSTIATLPRPRTSPTGGSQPPADTADILNIEHLPEWQATVAAWHHTHAENGLPQRTGISGAKIKLKPVEKLPPQAKWRAAGSRVSHMLASDKTAAAADQTDAEQVTPALVRFFFLGQHSWYVFFMPEDWNQLSEITQITFDTCHVVIVICCACLVLVCMVPGSFLRAHQILLHPPKLAMLL